MDAIFAKATEVGSTETDYMITFNGWLVSGVKDKQAYITDGTKGIVVYETNHNFKAGDKLTGSVLCKILLYSGSAELKGITSTSTGLSVTSNNEVPVVNSSIGNLAAINTGAVVKLEGLTYNGTELTDGVNTIKYGNDFGTFALTNGAKYDITGVFIWNGGTNKKIAPRSEADVTMIQTDEPLIAFKETLNLTCDASNGTIEVSALNVTSKTVSLFTDENCTTSFTESWFTISFNSEGNLEYSVLANTGDERKVYAKVVATGAKSDAIKVLAVTQAKYISDFATLPFEYDGDGTGELPDGLTAEGLGSPYTASPAMKFDTAGDYLILQINEQPGVLSFDIKGNSFSGSKFTVQTSADGQTYTDLKAYTELGAVQTVTFRELPADVRFIKWVYTAKDKGNVALGNIKLAKYVVLEKYFVKIASSETCELFVFDAADQTNPLQNGAELYSGTELLVSAAPAQGYELEGVSVTDAEGQAVQLTKNADGTYSFTMPASNISVTATVKEIAPPSYVNYTLAKSVERGKHYIIVGKSETGIYAMCEQKDNNRAALVIEANGEEGVKFMSDAGIHEFVINGFDGDYAIYDPSEESTGLLYAASGSSNYLRTTNRPDDNARWTISIDAETGVASIKAQGSNSRNIMRYNSNNGIFSCYGSGQKDVYLYVKEGDDAQEASYYKTIAYEYATLCLPFAVEVPEGVEAFIATAYSDDAVTLTKLDEGVVPAATGVVVAADKKTVAHFAATDKNVRTAENLLKGVTKKTAYADVTVQGKNAYALQLVEDEAKFCLVEGGSFAANTAYLELPAGQSQTIGLRFGDATMVEAVKAAEENSVIYDLTGRRVEKMTKGIYIVNGKKVMMK